MRNTENPKNKTQTVEEIKTSLRKLDKQYTFVGEFSLQHIFYLLDKLNSQIQQSNEKITGETSDGYHTFNELYGFRKLYNAGLFNEWAKQGLFNVHKSKKHSDGEECFGGGWFIVMATLPTGQISNHYELKDWDLFQCEEQEKADVWDGHTAQDVAKRLKAFIEQYKLERAKDNE